MPRTPLRFQATLQTRAGQQWVTTDGTLSADPEQAATFVLHRSPTGGERLRIDEACWSVLPDGLTEWVELQGKRQELADAVRGEIMVKLNLVESEELATRMENSAKITAAWATHRSTAMTALGMLAAREELARRLARWTVLAVDVPEALRDLAGGELPDERAFDAILSAWTQAEREAADRGNGRA